ncbi:histidine phosphatase family protein [Streptomyces sp. NBC_00892]|uniref:histidine phosphatase family protein n=1 Tax=Streptomyces sp. NBC_00892 TaxID=2975861 RepID=UPI002255105C|nr:histidine phosphatase family protein [Streptomyces sp. NBC_00892]MCX4902372.1 histidine phosphatase family protein [Streptomyces sp. NBC_00892]
MEQQAAAARTVAHTRAPPYGAAITQSTLLSDPTPSTERMKMLFLVRHAESIENATKYTGFYANPRPWTGPAAHALSRDVVGLTPRGFLQCLWLGKTLLELTGPDPLIHTSQYRRARDTAVLALPARPYEVTALLNEQHYGAATYMTKEELYATYPEGTQDRQTRKHLWTPPGADGESLACGVLRRATAFVDSLHTASAVDVVAFTHHTTILALRAVLERRPVTELVDEARVCKTPNAAILVYEQADGLFHTRGTVQPVC